MRKLSILLLALLIIPTHNQIRTLSSKVENITYDIHPIVHDIQYGDGLVELPRRVQLSLSGDIDKYTKDEAYDVLSLKHLTASTKNNYSDFKLSITTNIDNTNEHFTKLDAYTLDISDEGISIVGKDVNSCFYGLQSLREIFKQSNDSIRELSIKDYSNSLYRGVIEGLYGVPYNNFEIKDMIDFISYYKGNSFFYGPRHDAYFRTAWRDELPFDEVQMLKEISDHAKTRKINFYFGMNPVETDSFTMSNYERDLEVFINRFEQAYSLGVRNFFISADDVMGETVEPELHIRFMNDLAKWTKEKGDCGRILLTPSCYCGTGEDVLGVNLDYFENFKDELDDIIDIFWTGSKITSSISDGNFEMIGELTGRKPVFWLNWPVNDYAPTKIIMSKGEMLDVTYEDEEAPFLGVISNPQVLPYPSNLAIYQCLDYSWNYRDFNLNNVYDSAFERIEENEPNALRKVCSYLANATQYLERGFFEESPTLKILISEYKRLKEQSAPLSEIKSKMVQELDSTINAVDALIDNAQNRKLINQLKPYILAVKDTCNATKKYFDLEDAILNKSNNIRDKLEEATMAYNKIKENKAINLEYVKCNETLVPVDVCNAVLTPFLNELASELDYEGRLLSGLPTGIIYRGFDKIYSGSFDDMFDNNEDTFMMLDGYAKDKSYLQIDLEEVTEISSLKIVCKDFVNGNCYFPNVDISTNGIDYVPLTEMNSNVLSLDMIDNPVNARFLRLGNFTGKQLGWWISIAEIAINNIGENDIRVLTSGIKGVYMGDTSDMFDGDTSSYCWFNDYPEKDAYIEIDYRQIKEVSNLNIVFKDANNSICYMPLLEYSVDGKNFTKISDITSNNFTIEFDTPINLRYLRLLNNTNDKLERWVSVAEISFNVELPKVAYVGLNGIFSGSVYDLFDGNDETFLWFSSCANEDAYIQIEYNTPISANKFKVVFFNGTREGEQIYIDCYLSDLEVSLDGNEWISIETNNNDNLIDVTKEETITFKYVRIKNGTGVETPHWIAIASVEFA